MASPRIELGDTSRYWTRTVFHFVTADGPDQQRTYLPTSFATELKAMWDARRPRIEEYVMQKASK